MLFIEARFLGFFLLAFVVHWTLPWRTARKAWLLLCSYVFYGAWDERFLGLIWISTLLDYAVGWRLGRTEVPRARRALLLASVVGNLGLLGAFKYFGFFVASAVQLGGRFGIELSAPTVSLILPVGISFYTFQTLSYTIDVYRRRQQPTGDLLDLALFVAFFPQLVAGPIVRAAEFLPQLRTRVSLAAIDVRGMLVLFLAGFVKKACMADNLAPWADRVFAEPSAYGAISTWTGIGAYAAQIYCDFSGYSDMAIACAGLLGYRLCENFRSPYAATDVRDFWRRWHISLSTWLRDYLYIPLGGSKGSRLRVGANLMATMLLGGLWHGAAWTFVAWGALHGAALGVHRLWRSMVPAGPRPMPWIVLAWVATLVWVNVAWVFFRATTFGGARAVLAGAFSLRDDAARSIPAGVSLLVAALLAAHCAGGRAWPALEWRRLPAPAFAAGLGAVTAVALLFVQLDYLPFLYFQF